MNRKEQLLEQCTGRAATGGLAQGVALIRVLVQELEQQPALPQLEDVLRRASLYWGGEVADIGPLRRVCVRPGRHLALGDHSPDEFETIHKSAVSAA